MDESVFLFNHSFTCTVCGPQKSGKTYLVRDILKNYKSITNIESSTLKVAWAYGIWQDLYNEKISDDVICEYFSGLPNDLDNKPDILVIDDLMRELENSEKLADLFTKYSHHNNTSIIFITQNMFHRGKAMVEVSKNSDYYIVMKSATAKTDIEYLGRRVFPRKSQYLAEAYDDATRNKAHSYLKLDFTKDTPENMRVSTNIIPNPILRPYFYIPI